jgi:hypothetical protein
MDKKTVFFVIAAGLLFVTGCATNYGVVPSEEVAGAIEVKDSEFDSSVQFAGPQAFSDTRRGIFVDNEAIRLVAAQDKQTGVVSYGIYVRILYSQGWRFYNSVSFTDATRVEAPNVSREVNGCTGIGCIHTEEFVVPVELSRLEGDGDLVVRVNSRNGVENIISIPRSYIQGFLMSVRERTSQD